MHNLLFQKDKSQHRGCDREEHFNHTDRDPGDFSLAAKQTFFAHRNPALHSEKAGLVVNKTLTSLIP